MVLNLPIKSKLGWAIFDNLELHGVHTMDSTGSVSWHLSIVEIKLKFLV